MAALAVHAACEINPTDTGGSTGGGTGGTTSAGAGGFSGKDLSRFIGTWLPVSVTINRSCSNQASESNPSAARVVWFAGITSDLAQQIPGTSCLVPANVQGDTASLVGSPSCTFPGVGDNGNTVTVAETVTAYQFVVAADGSTATETGSTTERLTDDTTGDTTTCVVSEVGGSYQKQ